MMSNKMTEGEKRLYIFSWGFLTACVVIFLRFFWEM